MSEHTGTINLHGITKAFRARSVLDGLDLRLGSGVTGLLGPNGAGKTTLLRILATVLRADSGDLEVFGLDPRRDADRVEIRRRLGYVPQEVGFHDDFTAFEFVDYLAILKEHSDRDARHDEVRRVLDIVGLVDARHRKIRKLSGGMRRRVAIAQALLGSPELLVLDEPTAGLDPEQRLRFRELLSAVGPSTTTILSTHQTTDIVALCQRVVVLHGGMFMFDGSPAELSATAVGRVWLSVERHPGAHVAWTTGDGRVRNVGDAPPGAELAEPTIEDAYLLLVGVHHQPDAGIAA
ncbi:MAG TPA: ATP-binding cassette domain-containing protein [Microthrixaceae bacterium]|nr:ATP-binding cassette domain-containing protein [Microthrixaceae bacterium]